MRRDRGPTAEASTRCGGTPIAGTPTNRSAPRLAAESVVSDLLGEGIGPDAGRKPVENPKAYTPMRGKRKGRGSAQELPDRPPGSEHVQGHVLSMLRNDPAFAFRF